VTTRGGAGGEVAWYGRAEGEDFLQPEVGLLDSLGGGERFRLGGQTYQPRYL
jgi:hypothetical protein